MGDARFDPETNAERAAKGLAEAWHAGERAGYRGEYAVRAAYNYSFNPGGGLASRATASSRITTTCSPPGTAPTLLTLNGDVTRAANAERGRATPWVVSSDSPQCAGTLALESVL